MSKTMTDDARQHMNDWGCRCQVCTLMRAEEAAIFKAHFDVLLQHRLPKDWVGRLVVEDRKATPVARGFLAYFPRAIREVARVSAAGDAQHMDGGWDHDACSELDHLDAGGRHMLDHLGGDYYDKDGRLHLGKAAWRTMAALELFLEAQEKEEQT